MRPSIWSATLLFALTVLTLILLRPLTPIDETRYVAAAWEMYQGGSALVPHLNGALYAQKPPLLFWLIDLVWLMGGVSTLGARLVAPAFAVAAVALTGLLARRLWPGDPARAARAALILAVSPVFLLFGSTTMFDSILTVATLWAMLAMLWAWRRPDRWTPFLALGAAIALGVYAKGPVILIHVLPVALTAPLWAGRELPAWRWYRGVGLSILTALALVALWLVPALILGGEEYRTEVLWRQSAGRGVSSFAHQRPFWFFLAMLPLFLWPFGWTLPGLRALRPSALAGSAPGRFLSIWFIGTLLAFSLISGKQTHYLLPELPALALLLSGAGSFAPRRPRDLWQALPVFALMLLIVVAASGQLPALRALPFRIPLWAAGLGLVVAAIGIAGFLRLRAGLVALAALPLSAMLGLHFAAQPLLFARYDVNAIARAIQPYDATGIAITDGRYHAQFNFAARLRQPVAQVTDPQAAADWIAGHPDGILLSLDPVPPPGTRPVARFPYRSDTYTLFRPDKAVR